MSQINQDDESDIFDMLEACWGVVFFCFAERFKVKENKCLNLLKFRWA